MKKIVYGFLAALVAGLIVSCPAPWSSMGESSGSIDLGTNVQLPSDKSADTARSFSGPFTYQTLFPVRLDITVELYAQDSSESDGLRELAPDAAQVFLQLLNELGKEVFAGMVGADGKLGTTVYLPSANEDMTLRLQAEGFDTREVVIRNMVEYEEIVRTMAMGSSGTVLGSKGMEPDADGDGIPDSYDTVYDPSDPSYAVNIPAEGRLTVAFEDLYGRTDAGDADYNDFISSYSITEYHENVQVEGAEEGVSEEMLTGIEINVKAEEKIAGYDHIFGIRFNHFDGAVDVNGTYIDGGGVERTLSMSGRTAPLNIELFESTSKAKGKTVTFSLSFDDPQPLEIPDEDPDARLVDRPPYNPYLYVKNTGNDVHLVGEESLDGEYDPLMFMDGNNFPWALLVPDTWQPPTEAHRIEEFYPRFTHWRESGGELSRDWYLHDTPWEPVLTAELVSDIYPGSTGSSPKDLFVYDGKLFFSAKGESGGRELWYFDGVKSAQAADINPGNGDANPSDFVEYDNTLYFQADNGTVGRELWRYGSGVAELVADINEGSAHSYVNSLEVYDSSLYFSAAESGFTYVLFKYDAGDTVASVDEVTTRSPGSLKAYINRLFYSAYDGTDVELWSFDGLAETKAADIGTGSTSSYPFGLTEVNGLLYFKAADDGSDYELWSYDGTSATEISINQSGASNPAGFTEYNGVLFFSADDGFSGRELWRHSGNGSPELVADINPGGTGSNPGYLEAYDGKLYFAADDGSTGVELWSFDGNSAQIVHDINTTGSSNPSYLAVYNDVLYFAANDGVNGAELWRLIPE